MTQNCKKTGQLVAVTLLQEVDVLCDKVKDSEVKVEMDSQNTNLAEMLNKIRSQYDKLAKKNLKETEDWYQSKVCYLQRLQVRCLCCVFLIYCISSLFSVYPKIPSSFPFSSLTTSRWWRPKTPRSCSLESRSSRIC